MKKLIIRIFGWSTIRIIKQALYGRNRNRLQPELGRINIQDVDLIFEETWKNFNILKAKIPVEKTIGARIMIKNGALSLALYRAIGKVAADEDYVTELCTDILWKVYIKQIRIQKFVSKLFHRKPHEQMRMIQRIFLRFPLARPGYEWEIKETGKDVSYDITRCPVYDYFKTLGQEELKFFQNSWCTLDFPLAEHLVKGGQYERKYTLSAGDDRCDMCWKVV